MQASPQSAHDRPEALFRKNSKSFSLAARFFERSDREAVARLYAFCRYLDDLADGSREGEKSKLAGISAQLARGKTDGDAPLPVRDFLRLAEERGVPVGPAVELAEALVQDCGPRRIEDTGALLRFAYGVAGTVGLMMSRVIGADDPRAASFAIDLGIALQLTNIARDVAEDAGRERFYLPGEWVAPSTVQKGLAGDSEAISSVDSAIERTLELADRYYASARLGHWFIPHRNRRVVFLATALYQAIGRKILRKGSGAWRRRVVVGPAEKAATGLRATFDYLHFRRSAWAEDAPRHDDRLHLPLDRSPAAERKGGFT